MVGHFQGGTIMIDYAHNEASLKNLLESLDISSKQNFGYVWMWRNRYAEVTQCDGARQQ